MDTYSATTKTPTRRVIEALRRYRKQIHDVRIVGTDVDANTQLTLNADIPGVGEAVPLPAGQVWGEPAELIGKIGYLTAWPVTEEGAAERVKFTAYVDQSLRRVPLEDSPQGLAWTCEGKPYVFTAPHYLVPGEGGDFVADSTQAVTVPVPPEFFVLCAQFDRQPLDVLRAFIADAARLQDSQSNPRADRYSSNGSDERDFAEAYIERTFETFRPEPEALLARERRAETEAEIEGWAQDYAGALEQYIEAGGDPVRLFAQVEATVSQQEAAAGNKPEG